MKLQTIWFAGLLVSALGSAVQATDISKADNNDALSANSSWQGGAVPGSNDRALYTLNATARTNDLGGDQSWLGIVLDGNNKTWTINGNSTLTLGGAGIDMSNAGANLSLSTKAGVGANQTWTVAGSRTLTVSGVLSGNATRVLTKDGNGTLTASNGNNTFNGTIVVNAGTLGTNGADNALGTGLLTLKNDCVLSLAGGAIANPVAIPAGQSASMTGNGKLDGSLSGGGNLTHGSSGAFTLTLTADNSGYYGNITNTSTLALSHKKALGNGTLFLKDDPANPGVASSLAAKADFIRYNAITNNIVLQNNASVGASNCTGDFELAGIVSGSGGLKVNHPEVVLTLSGANTYAGPTEVAQGGLVILGSLASPMITVNNGTVLSGNGTVQSATVKGGAELEISGFGYTPDTLAFAGNLTLDSGSITTVKIFGTSSHDTFSGTGNGTLTQNGTILLDFLNDLTAAAGQQFDVGQMFPGWQSTVTGAGFNIQATGLPGGLAISTSGNTVTLVNGTVETFVLPEAFPIAMTYHGPFTQNNTLEEELQKYASVQIMGSVQNSAWDLVKSTYPDKMLLKQSAWGSDIETDDKGSIFPGHFLLKTGTKLSVNMTASDTVMYVDDYTKIAKDQAAIDADNADGKALYVLIYKLDAANQPDWSQAEQAIVTAINPDHSFVIERALFGRTPQSCQAGKTVVAKHMLFWSGQWQLNFSLQCPRGGPLNLNAAEWFAREVKRRIDETGADGIEFDVARWQYGSLGNHPMDCNNDLVTDYGMIDGVQSFGLGGQLFVRELRALLGPGKIIQMDSNGVSMQRGRKYVNGCQLESFPDANDYTMFSPTFLHFRRWTEEASPLPKFSYAYVKTTTTTMAGMVDTDGSDLDWHFRVGFASGLLAGMPSPFTSITDPDFIPDDDVNNGTTEGSGAAIWKWDEFVGGNLNNWTWLGQPMGPAVQVLDNLGGTDLLAAASWNWTTESGFVAVNQSANGTYTANMTAIPNSTVVAPGNVGAAKYFTGTIPKILAFGNRLEIASGAPLLQNGTEYTLEFEARGNEDWNYGGESFEEVPRALTILTPQGNKTMSVLVGADWKPYRLSFYCANNQTLVFGFSEQIGEAGIRNLRLYQGGAERWKREFENGIVLLNMSRQPWTTGMDQAWRRLTGTQNPDINNGQRVPLSATVPAWDALFLVRTEPADIVIPDGGNYTVTSEGYIMGANDTLSGNGTFTGGDLVALSGAALRGGGTGTAGTLSFSNNLTLNGQTLVFDLVPSSSGNNDRIDVAGGLTLNGNTTISLNRLAGYLSNGTYTLMTYGSLQGGTFVLDTVHPNLALNVGPTSLTLVVTGDGPIPVLNWVGNATNPVWDIGTTPNWLQDGNATVFQDGVEARFDDTAANTTVTLNTTVVPSNVTVGATANYTISGTGRINGITPLYKTGNGVLTLSLNNTYSGGTHLDAGILRLGSPAANGTCTALGSGTLSVADGTVITSAYNTAGGAQTVANDMTVDGNFTLGASGFTARVDCTGNVTLGSQERILTVINSANNSTFWSCLSGNLSGSAGLVKEGGGGLQLGNGSQNSTFSGDVTVRNGTLTVYNQAAIGGPNKTIYMNGGTIGVAGTQALSLSNNIVAGGNFTLRGAANASVTLNGPVDLGAIDRSITAGSKTAFLDGNISGAAGLTLGDDFSANGTVPSCILTGNNTFTGNLTLLNTVRAVFSNALAFGNGSKISLNQNSRLVTTDNMTVNKDFEFIGSNQGFSPQSGTTLTLGSASFTASGGGGLSPRVDDPGTLIFAGANTWTDDVRFDILTGARVVGLGHAAAFNGAGIKINNGAASLDNTSGADLALTGFKGLVLTSGFTFIGTHSLDLSGGNQTGFTQTAGTNRTINVAGNTLVIAGLKISGNYTMGGGTPGADGSLIKDGVGTLAIAGASEYTLDTIVNNGTLQVNNPSGSGTGTGNVTVNGNGTLGGTGTVGGNTLVETDGGFVFALSTAPGGHDKFDISGALTFNGTTHLAITSPGGASTGNYTLLTAAGGITGDAPANLSLPVGWNATVSIVGNDLVLHVASTSAAGFGAWAAGYNVTASLTANNDGDKFTHGEEYAFDLDPTARELGNVLASTTALSGGNVTLILAFAGNSSKEDINYVVRRAGNPSFTGNTIVGFWNGTSNWTTGNATYFANQTQSGAGDVKAINVQLSLPAASEPRQFLRVDIE